MQVGQGRSRQYKGVIAFDNSSGTVSQGYKNEQCISLQP
jgi:hypothetical protein